MRTLIIVSLMLVLGSTRAQNQPLPAVPALPAQPASLRARLTDDVIKQAVQQTLAGEKNDTKREQGTVLGAERYDNFSRKFSEAKLPDCLHSDGLKNQPTFFLGGILALPFIAVAAVRGVCR
jgi:hypothetical protein